MSAKEAKAAKTDKPAKAEKTEIAKYSDGHPHDTITCLEAKLILKPDPFTSVDSFRKPGKIVARTTKQVEKVDFIPDPEAGLRPKIRKILFFDTPDFRLYSNAFIFAPARHLRGWLSSWRSGNRLQMPLGFTMTSHRLLGTNERTHGLAFDFRRNRVRLHP